MRFAIRISLPPHWLVPLILGLATLAVVAAS
jgi:hypothetical protein